MRDPYYHFMVLGRKFLQIRAKVHLQTLENIGKSMLRRMEDIIKANHDHELLINIDLYEHCCSRVV